MDLSILKNIIDELRTKLPPEDLALINEFIDHDEWGIAYQHICIQLSEYEIPISRNLYEKIEKFGSLIGIPDAYWLSLEDLIKDK